MSIRDQVAGLKPNNRLEAVKAALPIDAGLRLVPVGSWILEVDAVVECFALWRFQARENFFSQFPMSVDGMRRYLAAHSIANPRNILFTIESEESEVYGHIGLKEVDDEQAQLDAVMKSQTSKTPVGLMKMALDALMMWSRDALDVRSITLEVMTSNSSAIRLYESCGYMKKELHPVRRVCEGDGISHFTCDADRANVSYQKLIMEKTLATPLA